MYITHMELVKYFPKDIVSIIMRYFNRNDKYYLERKWDKIENYVLYHYIAQNYDRELQEYVQQYGCQWCKDVTKNIGKLKLYLSYPVYSQCKCYEFKILPE